MQIMWLLKKRQMKKKKSGSIEAEIEKILENNQIINWQVIRLNKNVFSCKAILGDEELIKFTFEAK